MGPPEGHSEFVTLTDDHTGLHKYRRALVSLGNGAIGKAAQDTLKGR